MNDELLFIALTETWLRDHLDAEVNIEGYKLFRQDRNKSKSSRKGRDGGGTACYLKEDIAAGTDTVLSFSNEAIEVLGLYIKVKNLVLMIVYRQPDNRAGGNRSTDVHFKEAIGKIHDVFMQLPKPTPDIIMCGDFNLPHALWPEGKIRTGATTDERNMIEDLVTLKNEFFLGQEIMKPTHNQGNTLDLLFTNNPELLHSYVCNRTEYSDHFLVEGKINYKTPENNQEKQNDASNPKYSPNVKSSIINFNQLNFFSEKINWKKINEELQRMEWRRDFRGVPPEVMLNRFYTNCLSVCEKYVPLKRESKNSKPSKIPRDRRNLIRKRRRKLLAADKARSAIQKAKLEKEASELDKQLKKSYETELAENEHKAVLAIGKNSKYFYSYAKKFSKIKAGIGPLLDATEKLVSCPAKMAEILKAQYDAIFSTPFEPMRASADIFNDASNSDGPMLSHIYFEPGDIEEAIDELSANSAAGPDQFPSVLLKQCKKVLSKPLHTIWKESLVTGEIPNILKTANIVPIHKGGSRGEAKNYRPVALTSHIIKIFEKVLRKHIVCHLEENQLLNPRQHGFRAGRSCLSQLLSHFETITKILEDGDNVDVIYLDFAKAFDKVDFLVTLRKIKHIGINGNIGKWLYSFLTGRTQTVIVNGTGSSPSEVKSGVPQGSVLGPLLFLILLGDIDKSVASAFVSSFADDTRVGHRIKDASDVMTLQEDLRAIYEWSVENNMTFNSEKFECIRYGKRKNFHETTGYLSDVNSSITPKDQINDLGVLTSSNCQFKSHIENVTKSANKLCGWILRTFKTRAPKLMVLLWKSLVLSKLDYCSQLWSPIIKGDIQKLEMVQRSFIRKIDGMGNLDYWTQLKRLKLYSLERRRERYMIIYIWRILERQVPDFTTGRIYSTNEGGRLGRRCSYSTVCSNAPSDIKNIRYASLSIRGPQLFNTLPPEVRNVTNCSVEEFKTELDRFLSNVPDEPQIPGYTAMRRAESNSLVDMTSHHNSGIPVK